MRTYRLILVSNLSYEPILMVKCRVSFHADGRSSSGSLLICQKVIREQ